MSGHNNPHGRLGQPNSTWNNHLQVPSYIPRQPQIAHMSNERPSPMSWHTPTPPEALYSFMAANHKNVRCLFLSSSLFIFFNQKLSSSH